MHDKHMAEGKRGSETIALLDPKMFKTPHPTLKDAIRKSKKSKRRK